MNTKIYIVCAFFLGCTSFFGHPKEAEIRCFEISNCIPVFDMTGKVQSTDSSTIRVYYYGNMRLYDLMYIYDSSVDGKVLKSETRRHLFVYNKDSTYGFDFDIHKTPPKRKTSIDSLFQMEWIAHNKIDQLLPGNIAILTSSTSNKDSGTLIENYLIRDKKDSTIIGQSSYVFTNRLMEIDVSLSRKLDSIKNMKLCKVHSTIFPRYMKEYKLTISKFELSNELREVPISNKKDILRYFSDL